MFFDLKMVLLILPHYYQNIHALLCNLYDVRMYVESSKSDQTCSSMSVIISSLGDYRTSKFYETERRIKSNLIDKVDV